MVYADGGSFISETCLIRPEDEGDGAFANLGNEAVQLYER